AQIHRHRPRQAAHAPHVHRYRSRSIHRQPNPQGRSMSVYKDPRSPFWQFDFWWRGYRFHGSTKTATRREAEAIERNEREKAKQHVAQTEAARTSLKLDDVCGRYWQEVGQHHVGEGANNTWRELTRLIEFFGKDKLLTDITDDDVARLVAWRRGHRHRHHGTLLS